MSAALRFGALVRAMRLRRGLTQEQLALAALLDAPALRRMEASSSMPKRESVERVAMAFGAGAHARARLLARAGYWPWPELDDATLAQVLAAALAVIDEGAGLHAVAATEA